MTNNVVSFFLPIAKIDKDKRTVSGYASTPTTDSDGEVISLDAVKAALPDYMRWANIREMHKLSAVGTAQEANVDTKGLYLTAKIVDEGAWKKCLDGVYKGFSIGGEKLAMNGNTVTKLQMTEISVVDRPANGDCKFKIVKSAKSLTENETEGGFVLLKLKDKNPNLKVAKALAKAASAIAKAGPPAAHDGFSLPAAPGKTAKGPKVTEFVDDQGGGAVKRPDGAPSINDSRPDENVTRKTAVQLMGEEKKKRKEAKKAKQAKKAIKAQRVVKAEQALRVMSLKAEPMGEDFLELKKAAPQAVVSDAPAFLTLKAPKLTKGMGAAGTMSYSFDSLRGVQRSLLMEAQREGGDKKDAELAKRLGRLAKELADIIGQKASHEGKEALSLSDADDQWVTSMLGKDKEMTKAVDTGALSVDDALGRTILGILAKAARPNAKTCIKNASENIKAAKKARKECAKAIESLHEMHKASYLAKASGGKKDDKDDKDGFDHADAMDKITKAYSALQKLGGLVKSASEHLEKADSIVGEHGQMAQDGVDGVYEVPPGVKAMSNGTMARTGPGGGDMGSMPELMPSDGSTYAGKAAKLAKALGGSAVSAEVLEVLLENSRMEGQLAAVASMPSNSRRPYAFDMRKVKQGMDGGNGNGTDALFADVDPADLHSPDERVQKSASAKVIGNFLTNGSFGKSILDPSFRGMAANAGK